MWPNSSERRSYSAARAALKIQIRDQIRVTAVAAANPAIPAHSASTWRASSLPSASIARPIISGTPR
jgi:hypothetical protein